MGFPCLVVSAGEVGGQRGGGGVAPGEGTGRGDGLVEHLVVLLEEPYVERGQGSVGPPGGPGRPPLEERAAGALPGADQFAELMLARLDCDDDDLTVAATR